MSDNYNLVSKQNNGLWANKHKSKENHPDWKGVLNVTDEQLKKLIERRKEGDVNEHGNVEIQLAAYENTAREATNGLPYMVRLPTTSVRMLKLNPRMIFRFDDSIQKAAQRSQR